MVRTKMRKLQGKTITVKCRVKRFGGNHASPSGKTILLVNVVNMQNNRKICHHAWIHKDDRWKGIWPGDNVQFTAKIVTYRKYVGAIKPFKDNVDYRFSNIKRVKKLR